MSEYKNFKQEKKTTSRNSVDIVPQSLTCPKRIMVMIFGAWNKP